MEPRERRVQILGQAARLFGDRGYHETSISDIIAAAGIARGTFYLYFENKRGIFEELLDGLLSGILERITAVETEPDSPSPKEQLVDNIARVIELFADERHMLTILFHGAVGLDKEFDSKLADFYEKLTEEMIGSLDSGQRMGLVRPCDTRFAAKIALGAFKEALYEFFENEAHQDQPPRRVAEEILELFSRGVLVDGVSIP